MDKSKNYFFLTDILHYKISLNERKEILDFNGMDRLELLNKDYIGYILEKGEPNDLNRFPILDSIIYGSKNSYIYFYSTDKKQKFMYNETFTIQNLSCKHIENQWLICIFSSNDNLKISVFNSYSQRDRARQIIDSGMPSSSEGFLYYTLETNKKIFCANNNVESQITCGIISYDVSHNIKIEQYFNLSIPNNSHCRKKDCNLIDFLSEYLLCCSCCDYIICTRFTNDFRNINNFTLSSIGINSYLTIINNINYLSILFLNGNNIYKKNIYLPNCKNISKEVNEKIEINIKELFDIKNDSDYFLIFEEFNSIFLTIDLNHTEYIKNITYALTPDDMNLNIMLKNNILLDNDICIVYTISNQETYSSTCSINLIINKNESNESILEQEISKSEFKDKILKNISSFVDSTNIIEGNDFKAMVYAVDDIEPKEQLKN